MMKKTLVIAALLALASVPMALAHKGAYGSHYDTSVGPNPHCDPWQNPHDYDTGTPFSTRSTTQSASWTVPLSTTAFDGNLDDCSGDGLPADFDGDYEYGTGGGFLPAGQWAEHPDCDYGITPHHSPSFHVHSAFPAEPMALARFVIGADPTPPTYALSANLNDDDGWDCVTDGAVTPDTDPDDWLQSCTHTCFISAPPGNVNPFFGLPGGDGGWWVWIDCDPKFDGIPSYPQPCSTSGHIYA